MSNDAINEIVGLSVEELSAIARQALGEDAVASGPVEVKKIGRSAGHATTGIYRVSGEAGTASGERKWSAVVKALGVPEHASPGREQNPLKEPEIYRSGAFAEVCGGMRAARCYAILRRGGVELLWLEDLSAAPQPPWTPDLFIATARTLGRFNAHWPEQNLPAWEWLTPGGIRGSFQNEFYRQMFERLPAQQDDPLIRRFAPPDAVRELLQLWDESDALITQAEATSKGICHRDCHPKNLFPMRDAAGGSYTVGIDWSNVGIAPFGLDIGLLLASPMTWVELTGDEAKALVDPVFEAYTTGLAEEGWRGNEDQVRFTFLTRISFEAMRNTVLITTAAANPAWRKVMEEFVGLPIEGIVDRYAAARGFYLECRDEAMRLAKQL